MFAFILSNIFVITLLHIVSHYQVINITHEVIIEYLFYFIMLPLNLLFIITFVHIGKIHLKNKMYDIIQYAYIILMIVTFVFLFIFRAKFSPDKSELWVIINQFISLFLLVFPIFYITIVIIKKFRD